MKKAIYIFFFFFSFLTVFGQSEPFQGSWLGKVKTSGIELRIAFHISEKDGVIITKMDSPDQNLFGNSAYKTTVKNDSINIDIPLLGAKFDGVIKNEKLVGIFHQAGQELPLEMERHIGEITPPKRPQTPIPPFSYSEKEVVIKTSNEKVKLAGTLTIPEGKGPFPAVVLVSGSGPQDRNEELMGHKPFWVLANYLSRNGIAVLRYDDRGVAKSTGDFAQASSFDFADDAQAVWSFLHKQKKIDKSKVGIIGHSEGGLIAPIVASKNKEIGFIVLLAGPSVPGSVIITDQQELIMSASETDQKEIEEQLKMSQLVVDYIVQHESSKNLQQELTTRIEEWIKEYKLTVPKNLSPKTFAKQTAYSYTTNWMKTFVVTSPADYIKDVEAPILALFGEKDLQVSVRANFEPMQQLLHSHEGSKVYVFPNLNHLFQTTETGSPSEYLLIEETMAPQVLEYIQKWITSLN